MVIRVDVYRINTELGMNETVIFKNAAEVFKSAYDPCGVTSAKLSEQPQRVLVLTFFDSKKSRAVRERESAAYNGKEIGKSLRLHYHR